jgi:hypothetical protein
VGVIQGGGDVFIMLSERVCTIFLYFTSFNNRSSHKFPITGHARPQLSPQYPLLFSDILANVINSHRIWLGLSLDH